MKDYRLDRKANPDYILDVKTRVIKPETEEGKETEVLSVVFADGRVFKNVRYDQENMDTIIQQQNEQAQEGVENIGAFVSRKKMAGIMTGASIVGGPVIGAVAATLLPNPVTAAIGAGILTVSALVPSVCSLVRNSSKVRELEKIKYRDEHLEELRTYSTYPNALVGLSSSKRRWFEEMAEEKADPFCITEIDAYSKGDLEQIVDNMNTEKKYGFTYVKKPSTSAK